MYYRHRPRLTDCGGDGEGVTVTNADITVTNAFTVTDAFTVTNTAPA